MITVAEILAREGRTFTSREPADLPRRRFADPNTYAGPYGFTPTIIDTADEPADHGFACKRCGGPQPLGIGYVLDGHDAYMASAAMTAPCDCATR